MSRAAFLGLVISMVLCSSTNAGLKDWFKSQEQEDKKLASAVVNSKRQVTIEKYLLLAKAQSTEVLGYVWLDTEGNILKNSADPKASILVVKYAIRWEGPMTKGGLTQLVSAYDAKRRLFPVVAERVVMTNGVTNSDAMDTAAQFLSGLFDGANE